MSDDILKIGRVIEVNGSKTIGELDNNIDSLYRTFRSRKYAIGQVGSIVKIVSGDALIFGVVTSLRMEEVSLDGGKVHKEKQLSVPDHKRIEIELIGEGKKLGLEEDFIFQRGVSNYPLPGHIIYIASMRELKQIYARSDKPGFRVGIVSQAAGLPVYLNIDDLLGKHFAILGTTGSGKSCAVALILRSLITEYSKAHIIILDPHNEYKKAFSEVGECIDITKLELPHWVLNWQESIELFIGSTEHAATSQTNILKDGILKARKAHPANAQIKDHISVDTPVPYKLEDLVNNIEAEKAPLTASKQESHQKILNKIETLRSDKRFAFLLRKQDQVSDNLEALLSKYLRIPNNGKPISILDLSGVPSDVVDVVVSVLCRIIFDFSLWNSNRRNLPLLLVCEEAHRYAAKSTNVEFQSSKRALSRIAKEGRKYGVGLALVTQRPSELDESILSQCNTVMALRMNNDIDQQYVGRTLPDSLQGLIAMLPALRTKEALIVGEGVSVPLRLLFDNLAEDHRPLSENVPYAQSWSQYDGSLDDVKKAIENWRKQERQE